jgi:Flp pilus assembly protein TadD
MRSNDRISIYFRIKSPNFMKIRYSLIAVTASIFTVGTIPALIAVAQPTPESTQSQEKPEFYNDRGMSKYQSEDAKGAIDDYTIAIQLAPQNDLFYYNRGVVKLTLVNDFKGAISDFDRALDLNPKSAVAYYSRAAAKEWLSDVEGARADFGFARRSMQQQRGY